MADESIQIDGQPTSQITPRDRKPMRALPSRAPLTAGQIAARLGLAFSLLVGLLIAVGDLGLRRMDHVNADLQDIMGEQWTKLRLARDALTYSSRNSRITMQVFLLKDGGQIDSLLAARAKNTREISSLLVRLESLCKSEDEKQLLLGVKNARSPYVDSYQRALHLLIAEKNYEAAAAVMAQETTPALLKYHAAWDDFVGFEGDQLELAARQSSARYAAVRRLTLATIFVAVIIAAAIGLFVVKRMAREMTSRMQAEQEALREAHQEAEVFINAVPSILIGMDHASRITRWNLTAANTFGSSRSEVVGKQLTECGIRWLRPDMQHEVRSWCSERIPRRCDPVPFEMNGETRLLGLTITPVRVAGKASSELLIIGSDITKRSTLEEQLRQAQKLESVGQLAAGIAHEINTPTQYIGDNVRFLKDAFQDLKNVLANHDRLLLAAKENTLSSETIHEVTAALALVDMGYLLEEIPKAVEQTLEGVTRVSKLVSAMKEFSHPGTKEKVPADLNHAIESTIMVARNEWKYVAEMETEFDPSLPLIACHVGEFNQVILNLIVNAAHAISDVIEKQGSGMGKITVQTQNLPEWAEIRIRDTGSGIPEKVQGRVFDPFFTTKEIGKGTGQGLAIAHSVIIDKHNGSIHFETEVGKGTTFIIRLPHESKTINAKAVSA